MALKRGGPLRVFTMQHYVCVCVCVCVCVYEQPARFFFFSGETSSLSSYLRSHRSRFRRIALPCTPAWLGRGVPNKSLVWLCHVHTYTEAAVVVAVGVMRRPTCVFRHARPTPTRLADLARSQDEQIDSVYRHNTRRALAISYREVCSAPRTQIHFVCFSSGFSSMRSERERWHRIKTGCAPGQNRLSLDKAWAAANNLQ